MGRRPTVNLNLPPRMRARVRGETTFYYYDAGGKPRREIPLGSHYPQALVKWTKLHETIRVQPTTTRDVAWAISQYRASPQFADLGEGSKKDYGYALDALIKAFGDAPLDQVEPSHVTLYIDHRSQTSKHRALREKAVLSMIYAWCMARGYAQTNPASAVKTKRLPGRRGVYIEDEMFNRLYAQATPDLRDAIDLAYFTGQRPADVLSMTESSLRDGFLQVTQQKTGKPLRIAVSGALAELVERMAQRKRQFKVHAMTLLVDEKGRAMTKAKLRGRFEAARDAAGFTGEQFQFRDLRRKAAAEVKDAVGVDRAQALLGHSTAAMTEHYATGRGQRVVDLPRKILPQKFS